MSHVYARLKWMFLHGTGKKSAGKIISVFRLFSGGFRDHRETYPAPVVSVISSPDTFRTGML
jgi:hypothetical protein